MRSTIRLGTDLLLARAMRLLPIGAGAERSVRLRDGTVLTYRLNRGDLWALHEVYFEELYRLPDGIRVGTLVDLGANIGLAGLWLAKRHDAPFVLAVEPDRANASLAERNLRQNGVPCAVLRAAVGASDGHARFEASASSTNGRLAAASADGPGRDAGALVETRCMDSVLNGLNGTAVDPLFVKMDVEGAEHDIFHGNLGWLAGVQNLLVEVHEAYIRPADLAGRAAEFGLCVIAQDRTPSGDTLSLLGRRPAGAQGRVTEVRGRAGVAGVR